MLPLLAFTLAHLYEKCAADNELTLSGYDRLGRVKGVIDTAVRQAFDTGVATGELPKNQRLSWRWRAPLSFHIWCRSTRPTRFRAGWRLLTRSHPRRGR